MDSNNLTSDSNSLFSNENSLQMDIDDNMATNNNNLKNDFIKTEPMTNDQPQENEDNDQPTLSTAGQQLIDFLQYLDDYKPTIPDSITSHIMKTAGFNTTDQRILRLASLASQKFIADIVNDAFQHCKMRTALSQNKKSPKDKRHLLTFDDLLQVLPEHGIDIKKPQYFY